MKITCKAGLAGLWLTCIALMAATVHAIATSVRMDPVAVAAAVPVPRIPPLPDSALLQQAADSLRQRNPFRLDRMPTARPFGTPEPTEAPPVPVVAEVQRPVASVVGIVGGPPWKALIEGLPGQETGALLAAGEEWNGFLVKWIRRDSVMLVTPDTTLILILKQAWR
jgi:hypothetical protein